MLPYECLPFACLRSPCCNHSFYSPATRCALYERIVLECKFGCSHDGNKIFVQINFSCWKTPNQTLICSGFCQFYHVPFAAAMSYVCSCVAARKNKFVEYDVTISARVSVGNGAKTACYARHGNILEQKLCEQSSSVLPGHSLHNPNFAFGQV